MDIVYGNNYVDDRDGNGETLYSHNHTNEGGGLFTRLINLNPCIYPSDNIDDITKTDTHNSAIYLCSPLEPCINYPFYKFGYINLFSLKNIAKTWVKESTCDLIVDIDLTSSKNITWITINGQKCFDCCSDR